LAGIDLVILNKAVVTYETFLGKNIQNHEVCQSG